MKINRCVWYFDIYYDSISLLYINFIKTNVQKWLPTWKTCDKVYLFFFFFKCVSEQNVVLKI